jgi:hypothetical protein
MKALYSNESLRNLLNWINIGLVNYEIPESIIIVTKNNPDVLIKPIEVNIEDFVFCMANNLSGKMKKSIDTCEVAFIDYLVFSVVKNEDAENELINIPLIELMLGQDLMNEITNSNSNFDWSLDNKQWDLFIDDEFTVFFGEYFDAICGNETSVDGEILTLYGEGSTKLKPQSNIFEIIQKIKTEQKPEEN